MKYLNLPPKFFALNDGKNPNQKNISKHFESFLYGGFINRMHVIYGHPQNENACNCILTETPESNQESPIPSFNAPGQADCSRL